MDNRYKTQVNLPYGVSVVVQEPQYGYGRIAREGDLLFDLALGVEYCQGL